jgi:hypothetical protein
MEVHGHSKRVLRFLDKEVETSRRSERFKLGALRLNRQLLGGGEMMLFAANFAVVFGGHLKKFKAAIGCEKAALIAEGLHFCGG